MGGVQQYLVVGKIHHEAISAMFASPVYLQPRHWPFLSSNFLW